MCEPCLCVSVIVFADGNKRGPRGHLEGAMWIRVGGLWGLSYGRSHLPAPLTILETESDARWAQVVVEGFMCPSKTTSAAKRAENVVARSA